MFDFLSTPEFQTAVANVIVTVLGLLAAAITSVGYRFLHSKLSAQQLTTLEQIAKIAVMAAEQAGIAGIVADKKQAAIEAASALLASKGIKVTAAELDAAIESAVATELNRAAIGELSYIKSVEVARNAMPPEDTVNEEPAA